MAKFELSWFAPRKCWKKFKDGKTYYLGKGKCREKWDMDGYRAALGEWEGIQKGLKPKEKASADAPFLTGEAKERHALNQAREYRNASEPLQPTADERDEIDKALAAARQKIPAEKTVGGFVTRFLDFKRSQAVTDQRSNGRFVNLKLYAEQFRDFVGADRRVEEISALTLTDWHTASLTLMGDGKLSSYGARDRLQVAKQFVTKCWEWGVIELPRNIKSKDLSVSVNLSTVEIFETEELAKIVNSRQIGSKPSSFSWLTAE